MAKINHKDLLEYFIHEVTQINSVIKASSELLSKRSTELKDKKTIAYHANLVHENSAILNYLVDVVNYKLNPAFFLNQDKDLRNVHGKYSKIIQVLLELQFKITGLILLILRRNIFLIMALEERKLKR